MVLHVYTIEQVYAFSRAGRENKLYELLDFAVAIRAAQADTKSWKGYVESINKELDKLDTQKKEPKPVRVTRDMLRTLDVVLGGKFNSGRR